MITTAKDVLKTEHKHVDQISFLLIDGSQKTEEFILDNNTYLSKEDYNKYGKIEFYSNSNGDTVDTKYYLKQFRGGRPGELLVDPYGMMSKAEDLSAFVTQRGSRFCEYVAVPQDIYNSYVFYLRLRDSRHFRTCEKYLLDKVL